ncbi:hypothetical protein PHYC_03112 [Phycisphaerales bacterium]|nr:hypothetical protein PHYC_03112 [Phycisphaerales bacterium]
MSKVTSLFRGLVRDLVARAGETRRPRRDRAGTSSRSHFEPLESRQLLSTIIFEGGPFHLGNDFNDPANWVGGVLPGPLDDAIIPNFPFASTIRVTSSITVNSITANERVKLEAGVLELNTTSEFRDGFDLDSGALWGSGDVHLFGTSRWLATTPSGDGRLIVTAGAILNLDDNPSASRELRRNLDNFGSITWNASDFSVLGIVIGSTVTNAPGATFTVVQSNALAFSRMEAPATHTSGSAAFINSGTFTKQGSGDLIVRSNIGLNTSLLSLDFSGQVLISGGEVVFEDVVGPFAGLINIPTSTAGVVFSSSLAFQTGFGLTGIGSAVFSAGHTHTFAADASLSLPDIEFNGLITGGGNVTIAGAAVWRDGTMAGPGTTTIALDGSLTFFDSISLGTHLVLDRRLDNFGSLFWGTGQYLDIVDGTVLTNKFGATFTISPALGNIFYVNGLPGPGNGRLLNEGNLLVTTGGTVAVVNQSGNLEFSNPGSVLLTDTTLELTVAPLQVSSGTLTGGAWAVAGSGALDLPAGVSITTLASGAAVTLDGPSASFSAISGLATNNGTLRLIDRAHVFTTSVLNQGTIDIAAGATLEFQAPASHGIGSVISGNGTLILGSVMHTISGSTIWSVSQVEAPQEISGPGDLSVGGEFHWNGGTLTGSGLISFAAGATVDYTSGSLTRRLQNSGTLHIGSGATLTTDQSFDNFGTIQIDAGAALQYGSGSSATHGEGSSITGAGILALGPVIHTITGATTWSVPSVPVPSGTTITGFGDLTITGTFDWAGSTGGNLTGTGRTILAAGGPDFTMAGGIFDLQRTLRVDRRWLFFSATITGPADLHINGAFTWFTSGVQAGTGLTTFGQPGAGGSITFTGAVQSDRNLVFNRPTTISGGSLLGAGDFTFGAGLTWTSGTLGGTGIATVNGPATISDGTCTGDRNITFNDPITLTSGTLTGSGDLTFAGGLTWSGGTLAGTGQAIIPFGKVLDRTGGDLSRDMHNFGTFNCGGTDLLISGGSVITNKAGGVFNHTSGVDLVGSDVQAMLVNEGQYNRNSFGQVSFVSVAVTNAAGAEMHVINGTLFLGNGSILLNLGHIEVDSGTGLAFGAGSIATHGAGSSIGGPGALALGPVTHTISGATTWSIPDVSVPAGTTITGSGDLTVTQAFTWTGISGGSLTGTGQTILASGGPDFVMATGTTFDLHRPLTINRHWVMANATLTGPADLYVNWTFSWQGVQTGPGLTIFSLPMNFSAGTWPSDRGQVFTSPATLSGGTFSGTGDVTFNQTLTWTAGGFGGTGTATVLGAASISGGTCTADRDLTFSGGLSLNSGELTGSGNVLVNGSFTWTGGLQSGTGTTSVGPDATFTLSSGTRTSNRPIVFNRAVELSGGTFAGAGNITFAGGLTWTNGTLAGSGLAIIPANQVLTLTGGSGLRRSLDNFGTINYTAGLGIFDGSVLTNKPGGTFNHLGSSGVGGNTNSSYSQFVNQGTYNKTNGGLYGFSGQIVFTNAATGVMNIDAGIFEWTNSDQFGIEFFNSGLIDVDAGAMFRFTRGASHNAGSSIIGSGTFDFNSGTHVLSDQVQLGSALVMAFTGGDVTLNQSRTFSHTVTLSGGMLTGTGDFTFAAGLNWSGGSLRGAGLAIIPANQVLTLSGGGGLHRSLDNFGTINYTAGLGIFDGSVLTNKPGGTFNHLGSSGVGGNTNSSYSQFVNQGTYNKANGGMYGFSGQIVFTNAVGGVMNIDSGIFEWTNSDQFGIEFLNSGLIDVDAGATFRFTRGAQHNAGSSITGGGTVDFNSGTHVLSDQVELPASIVMTFTGGDVTLNQDRTFAHTVTLSNGALTGSGNFVFGNGLNWSGGMLGGTGLATIPAGQVLTHTGSNGLRRALDNSGTFNLSSGSLNIYDGTVLTNKPGATLNHASSNAINGFTNSSYSQFVNQGTYNKTIGGMYGFATQIMLTNTATGVMNINAGIFEWTNSDTSGIEFFHSGQIVVSAGATFRFTRGAALNSGSSITGGGTVEFTFGPTVLDGQFLAASLVISGGTVSFNQSQVLGVPVTLSSGTLTGTGDVTFSGGLNWTGGTMSGTGKTIIPTGQSVALTSNSITLNRSLDNFGTITVTGPSGPSMTIGAGAVLTNKPGAVFNHNFAGNLHGSGDNPFESFLNQGTYNKNGSGTSGFAFDLVVTNAAGGVMNINAGVHSWSTFYSATNQGTLNVASGATVSITSNLSLFDAGTLLGGTWNIAGALAFPGSTTISALGPGATVLIDGPAAAITRASGGSAVATLSSNDGSLTLANGAPWAFITSGTFNNPGLFRKAGTGSVTTPAAAAFNNTGTVEVSGGTLTISATSQTSSGTLTGGTWIVLNGATLNLAAANIVTNEATITLSGAGAQIQGLEGLSTNSGTLTLNDVDFPFLPAGDIFNNPGTFITTGSVTIPANITFNNGGNSVHVLSGVLAMLGNGVHTGNFILSAGSSVALGGTQVFEGSSSFTGSGLVSNLGTMKRDAAGDSSLASGITFDNDGILEVASGRFLINGPITQVVGDVLTGGVWKVLDGAALELVGLDLTTNNAEVLLVGTGAFSALDHLATNNGTITLADAHPFDFNPAGGVFSNPGEFFVTGTGAVHVPAGIAFDNSGNSVHVQGGAFWLDGGGTQTGHFDVAAAARLYFSGGTTVLTATSTITGAGDVFFQAPSASVAALVTIAGTLSVDAGTATLTAAGSTAAVLENAANLVIASGGSLSVSGSAVNDGTVSLQDGDLSLLGGGAHTGDFAISAGRTLSLAGSHSFSPGSDISGAGNLSTGGGVSTAGLVGITGTATFTGGTSSFTGGFSSGPLTTSAGASVAFTTNIATGTVTNDGAITLGTRTLSIAGGYTQSAAGSLNITISGTAPGQFGRVLATGAVQLSGALNATFTFPINRQSQGSSYQFITGSSVSGSFSSMTIQSGGSVRTFAILYSGNSVSLLVPFVDYAKIA